MLPAESALAAVLRPRSPGEPAAPGQVRPMQGRTEKKVGSWAELARTLSSSPALKKRGMNHA